MRINFKLLYLAVFLLPGISLFAQQKRITGTVTDPEGIPLLGVNILVEGTGRGTQTDFDGNYSIEAAEGEVLIFSYLGMASVNHTVDANTQLNVVMNPSEGELKEVIITAVGIERERSSLGSATTNINSEDLVSGAQSNISDALKGKVAGVTISSASTDPGASSGVIIRGISSLGGSNQPPVRSGWDSH